MLASSCYEFDIEPIKFGKIGSHIYYPEGILFDGFEDYPGEEAALRKCLEEKDKGQICYEFRLNQYSWVKVDAKTGEIIEYEFSDGDLDIWDD